MRRFLSVPIALMVPLAFVSASGLDARLNPPCDAAQRGLVIISDMGRSTVLEGQPGNSRSPCIIRPDRSQPKRTYVPQ